MISKLSNMMRLRTDRKGVTALEYGLIAALIAAVVATAVKNIGTSANTAFTSVNTAMTPAASR